MVFLLLQYMQETVSWHLAHRPDSQLEDPAHHKLDHVAIDFHLPKEEKFPEFADLPHQTLKLLDQIDKVLRHHVH